MKQLTFAEVLEKTETLSEIADGLTSIGMYDAANSIWGLCADLLIETFDSIPSDHPKAAATRKTWLSFSEAYAENSEDPARIAKVKSLREAEVAR